jgi:hypothetical protein
MLHRIVNNLCAQISRRPCSQSRRQKYQHCTGQDHGSREAFGLCAAATNRRRGQMPEFDNEWNVIENGEEKPGEVNRADDPESFFELKLCRPHVRERIVLVSIKPIHIPLRMRP